MKRSCVKTCGQPPLGEATRPKLLWRKHARRLAAGLAVATGYWWVLLISGVLWVLLSGAILRFNLTSVGPSRS